MEVMAIIPKTGTDPQKYVVMATEKEIDKISGIAAVEHIAGRIQVGHEIQVATVYDKIDKFAKNENQLKAAETILREMADSVKTVLP